MPGSFCIGSQKPNNDMRGEGALLVGDKHRARRSTESGNSIA
jgi:hypothetical protein